MSSRKQLVFMALLLLVSTVLISSKAEAQRQRYPVPTGQKHPELKLPSVEDGTPISLADYQGKKVVLLHFASW